MSIVELVLLAVAGFFAGYGLGAWRDDEEELREARRRHPRKRNE